VLLAEDSAINQRVAVSLLTKQGHTVRVAVNGREAVELFGQEAFDLVLMDVEMPEVDGFEATAQIRKQEAGTGRRIPIVALTAHAMKGDREKCLAAGMDGYVSKPILARDLFQALETHTRPVGPGQLSEEGESKPSPVEFNEEKALERTGGDRVLLRELIDMFATESVGWLRDLGQAIAMGEAEKVKRLAHTVKGAVGTFGAESAFEAAVRLEARGRGGDLSGVDEEWQEFQKAIGRLREALAGFRA
jgi:CheY-like chemotaxis protein